MAGVGEEKIEDVSQGEQNNAGIGGSVTIGVVSCDDEGYETAGKKELPTRAKNGNKDGKKVYIYIYIYISNYIMYMVF